MIFQETYLLTLLTTKFGLKVATKDKIKTTNKIDGSNCQAVYFGESKRFLKLGSYEHKRCVKNWDSKKNEIVKHCWEEVHNFEWNQRKLIRKVA